MPSDQPSIPIELLLAGRDLSEPKLSPDGSAVAFVQRWRGASSISLVPTAGGAEQMLTLTPDPAAGRGLGGGCFDWLPDAAGVVYAAADGEIWLQPLSGAPRRLTMTERTCRAPTVSSSGAFMVFVVDEAEVWMLSLVDGGEPVRLDDGQDAFCFDPAISPDTNVVTWQAWSPPAMPWDAAHLVTKRLDDRDGPLSRWRPDDAAAQQPRFGPDGSLTCVHDASGWLNVCVAGRPVLPEPFEQAGPTWGMGQRSYTTSPDGERVAFCRNENGFGRLGVVDLATGHVTNIGKGGHGQLTWRGGDLVALRTGAVTPTQIVRYDMSGIGPARPQGAGADSKPERTVLVVGPPIGWSGRDLPEPTLIEADHAGVVLHARRYAAGRGRMLCWVHGGPTDQWQADFRPRISYWWSRGWDVLVVDPRGSTGHGRAYQRALNGAWGRVDVDDTAALIRHAHSEGWAAPESTVVIGASSGGLTVLGLLADHPELVAGGVASYPVSDLAALAEASHRFEAHYTDTLVGPPDDAELYRSLSPLTRADQIRGPLLVFHGTEDPVVPISQSEALVEAVASAGGDVELVVYDGEGHGFRDPLNTREEYARTERFLESARRASDAAGR